MLYFKHHIAVLLQNGGLDMLLEFTVQNYKSFTEKTVFSMTKAAKQSGLDYSLIKGRIKGKNIFCLCSSVIYGPNASGKTNIIGAMDTLRSIVLRGNVRNSEERTSPNTASVSLELIPNNKLKKSSPVNFSVEFIEENILIKYFLSIDLGLFMDSEYKRRIISEELYVNKDRIFHRGENLVIENLKSIKNYLSESSEKNFESAFEIAENNLNREELFLTNGFKQIFSPEFVNLITEWFSNKFMVIYRADSMQLIKRFSDSKQNAVYVEKTTNEAAKIFGINSNDIGYIINNDEHEAKLCSVFRNQNDKQSLAIPAELFESYGTIRFINIFPLVINAMQNGGTLIVDEFDASIHPIALMNIINIFHNDDINIHHAQLIFNTHNPIFLNSNLFRRDEIKFVERDDENHFSTLYALSDFGTSGDKGVRKHEDYMKNYFINQYGAVKDIDFTSVFEKIGEDEG